MFAGAPPPCPTPPCPTLFAPVTLPIAMPIAAPSAHCLMLPFARALAPACAGPSSRGWATEGGRSVNFVNFAAAVAGPAAPWQGRTLGQGEHWVSANIGEHSRRWRRAAALSPSAAAARFGHGAQAARGRWRR